MTTYDLKINVSGNASGAVGALNNAKGAVGGLGKAAGAAAAVGVAALAAGLVALGAAAGTVVTKGMEFEKTMSGVQAVLTPTAQEMQALNATALQLGSDTAFSAQQAAAGIEMLAKNGLSAGQIMAGAAQASLDLAAATGTDLSTSANIATDAMSIFGIEAGEMNNAINGIAGVTVASKFGIDDYALALGQGGAAAKNAGLDFDEFNVAIAAISPNFNSGSSAGDSMKNMLQRLVPSTAPAKEAMQALGLVTEDGSNKFFDAEGNLVSLEEIARIMQGTFSGLSDSQRAAAMQTIFGNDAMNAAVGLMESGEEGVRALATALGDTSAAEQAKTRMDNLSGSMDSLVGSLETAAIQIYQQVAPALKGIVDGIIPIVNDWGPRLATFLGDTFALAAQEAGDESTLLGGALSGMQEMAKGVSDWFNDKLMPAIRDVGAQFNEMLLPHVEELSGIFGDDLMPIINDVGALLGTTLVGAIETLGPIVVGLVDHQLTMMEIGLRAIGTVYREVLRPALVGMGEWLGKVTGGWENLKTGAERARDILGNLSTTFGNLAGNIGMDLSGKISETKAQIDRMVDAFRGLPERIKGAVGNLKSSGIDFVNGFRDGFWERIDQIRDEIHNAFKDLIPQSVKDALGIASPSSVAIDLGANFSESFGIGAIQAVPAMAGPIGPALAAEATRVPLPIGGGSFGGGGGVAPIYVTVNVSGSVMAERELVEAVRRGLLDIQRRNATTGIR